MNPRVETTIEVLKLTFNDHITFQKICQFVEVIRNKPLIIEADAMPLGLTGYCIPLSDVDLICYRERSRDMDLLSQLHEIGHILLGHIDSPSNMPAYSNFIREKERIAHSPSVIKYRGMQFDDPEEHDAEALATLLLGLILHTESELSPVARELYGD